MSFDFTQFRIYKRADSFIHQQFLTNLAAGLYHAFSPYTTTAGVGGSWFKLLSKEYNFSIIFIYLLQTKPFKAH